MPETQSTTVVVEMQMTQSLPYIKLNYSVFFHSCMRFIVRSVCRVVQANFLMPNVFRIITIANDAIAELLVYIKVTRSSAISEGLARHLSVEILQLQNISLENPIVWHFCVILRLAVLIQYRNVTDTHTQTNRQTHDDGIYCT